MGWGLGSFGRGVGVVVVGGGTLGFGSGGLGFGLGLGLGLGLGFRFNFMRNNFKSVIIVKEAGHFIIIHGHRLLVQGAEFIHSREP